MFENVIIRPDNTYVITINEFPYHVIESDTLYDQVRQYVTDNPDAVQSETFPTRPTQDDLIKGQIFTLESLQTPRRIREAIAGTDNGWLANLEAQIAELRLQLSQNNV